jgi:redox-sensing transcriptional repressor
MLKKIPELSMRRLVLYYRYLEDLNRQNVVKVLSDEIAGYFNLDPAQVRKDLSYIGQLGKRGCGYDIPRLLEDIQAVSLQKKPVEAVLIGCGKLGSALLGYPVLRDFAFHIERGFDTASDLINTRVRDILIDDYRNLESFIKSRGIKLAIVAVPKENAREVMENLVKFGIRGILNFSPVFMHFDRKVMIKNVDFSVDFNIFRYQLFKENYI